jgi:hypothetical protein
MLELGRLGDGVHIETELLLFVFLLSTLADLATLCDCKGGDAICISSSSSSSSKFN